MRKLGKLYMSIAFYLYRIRYTFIGHFAALNWSAPSDLEAYDQLIKLVPFGQNGHFHCSYEHTLYRLIYINLWHNLRGMWSYSPIITFISSPFTKIKNILQMNFNSLMSTQFVKTLKISTVFKFSTITTEIVKILIINSVYIY